MDAHPILERDEELALLTRMLDQAISGRFNAAFIVGDAGIGKTTLAQELAAQARARGAATAWGRTWDVGDAPPLWPWMKLLEELGIRITWLTGDGDNSEGARFRLFEQVAAALHERARQDPLVLILDDIHALDDSSAVLMRYLLRYVSEARIFLVATYRDDEVDPASVLGEALGASSRDATVLRLRRLSPEASRRHFARVAGFPPPAAVGEAIERAAEGNPLFVEEVAHHLAGGADIRRPDRSVGFRVPRGIEDVLARKIQNAGGPSLRSLLEAAAVLGRTFDSSVLEEILELERGTVDADLAEATAARLVEEVSAVGRYTFSHTFIREFLYERQSAAKRRELHRRAAQVLKELDPEAFTGAIADHLFKAGRGADPHEAFTYSCRAAEKAMNLVAYEDAARHYHRALILSEPAAADATTVASVRERLRKAEEGGDRPSSGQPKGNVFRREGEFWTVTFDGRTSRFKDTKGFRWLAILLNAPGREFHALDLAGTASAAPRVQERSEPVANVDPGEVLDARARNEYVRRIQELEEEIEEADGNNDLERAGRLREELWFLSSELVKATGLGGRARKMSGESERARVSVTRAIRLAIQKISSENKALGRHLEATISTGTFTSYAPDPRVDVGWQL